MMARAGNALFGVGLSLWVGGLAALALVAAPVIFRNAPSREAAGTIFAEILRIFGWLELGFATAAALGLFLAHRAEPGPVWGRAATLVTMIVLLLVLRFGVTPAMRDLRGRMGAEGPERVRFERLHKVSEKLYGANLLLGLALLGFHFLKKSG